jgi:hypothetical protein
VSETVLERHYRDRMQSVRQFTNLPEPDRAAMSWDDHADLVALCVELSVSVRDLMEREFSRIFKNPRLTIAWIKERRRVIIELCDGFVQLAQTIRPFAIQAWQTAVAPQGKDFASVLDSAINHVVEAKGGFLERWLVGSPAEEAALKDSIARGDVLDLEEAFADIARMDVETWRKSVDEHKRQMLPGA